MIHVASAWTMAIHMNYFTVYLARSERQQQKCEKQIKILALRF